MQSILQAADKVCGRTLLAPTTRRMRSGTQIYAEYTLYEVDVRIAGVLSDSYIVEVAVADKESREVLTPAETRNMLCLLCSKVDCSGGNQ